MEVTDTGTPPSSLDDEIEMYRRMVLIRGFEERVARRYNDGEVPRFLR